MSGFKQRILLVEDDVEFAESLKDVLEDAGLRIDVAHGGQIAVEAAHQKPYDAAIVDLKLPDIDGVETCHRLKQEQPALTTVILTAYMGSEQLQRVTRDGVERVFPKPAPLDELLAALGAEGPGNRSAPSGAVG